MPWVRFTATFHFRAKPRVWIVYKPGEYLVKRACADQAIATGKAIEIERPKADANATGRLSK